MIEYREVLSLTSSLIFRLKSRHNRAIRLAKFLRAGLRKVAMNSGSGVQSSENEDVYSLDILFSSNHNIHKSSCGLFLGASDPLIDRF